MKARTGFEAWRERNPGLPFPDEYRIMRDGTLKVIWDRLEKDWYRAHVEFKWGPDGAPLGGDGDEEAIGQPDYWSNSYGIPDEYALTHVLADYA
mgnify:CR=1 FL=1